MERLVKYDKASQKIIKENLKFVYFNHLYINKQFSFTQDNFNYEKLWQYIIDKYGGPDLIALLEAMNHAVCYLD